MGKAPKKKEKNLKTTGSLVPYIVRLEDFGIIKTNQCNQRNVNDDHMQSRNATFDNDSSETDAGCTVTQKVKTVKRKRESRLIRKIPCPVCEFKTTSPPFLKTHIYFKHPNFSKTHKKKWNNLVACVKRIKEKGIDKFPCMAINCSKKFGSYKSLRYHIGRCHEGQQVLDEFGFEVQPSTKTLPKIHNAIQLQSTESVSEDNHSPAKRNGKPEKMRNVSCTMCAFRTSKLWYLLHHMNSMHQDLKKAHKAKWSKLKACIKRRKEKGKDLFPCTGNKCSEKFNCFVLLRNHVEQSHNGERILDEFGYPVNQRKPRTPWKNSGLKCKFCSIVKPTVQSLQRHLNSCHPGEGSFYINGQKFTPQKPLPSWIKQKQNVSCVKCGWIGKNLHNLRMHVGEKHPEVETFEVDGYDVTPMHFGSIVCHVCNKIFRYNSSLRDHLFKRHPDVPEIILNNHIVTQPSQPKHNDNIRSKGNVQCPKCLFSATTPGFLIFHITRKHPNFQKTHNVEWTNLKACIKRRKEKGEDLFPCRVNKCSEKFNTFILLCNHVKKCHEGEEVLDEFGFPYNTPNQMIIREEIKCVYCNREYGTTQSFQTHLNIHHHDRESVFINGRTFTPQNKTAEYAIKKNKRSLKRINDDNLKLVEPPLQEVSTRKKNVQERVQSIEESKPSFTSFRINMERMVQTRKEKKEQLKKERLQKSLGNADKSVLNSCQRCHFETESRAAYIIHLRLHHEQDYITEIRRLSKHVKDERI